jgi:hypothetical protein
VAAPGNAQQQTSWTVTLPPGFYYWSVQALDGAFVGSPFAAEEMLDTTVSVSDELPLALSFRVVGGNPVVGSPHFSLELPSAMAVDLSLCDMTGRRVLTLASGDLAAGYHAVDWSSGEGHRVLPAGVYFARLTAGSRVMVRKIVLIR